MDPKSNIDAESYLPRALSDGHAKIIGEGRQQRILYVAVNHSERFSDAEERVRAEFWAELIYRLGYPPSNIGVEITVPDRVPRDAADLVVFYVLSVRGRIASLSVNPRVFQTANLRRPLNKHSEMEVGQSFERIMLA